MFVESPRDGAIVRSPQVTVVGWAWDDDSGLDTLTCNGTPTPVVDFMFTCAITLTPGSNVIGLQATDLAANVANQPITVVFDNSLSVSPPATLTVRTSSLATVKGNPLAPANLAVTYAWTQISGPSLTLQGANTSSVRFLTPAMEGVAVLEFAATNSSGTATGQVQVSIQNATTLLSLAPDVGEGHASTLTIASTTLGNGLAWAGPSAPFVITLGTTDSAFIDAASVDDPLAVHLDAGEGVQNVTAMFTYDAVANTLTLNSGQAADLKALLVDTPMSLEITGVDDSARLVYLTLPLQSGRFTIEGTIDALPGTPPATLAQTLVLIQGIDREFTAAVNAATDGTFEFSGVYADDYTITAIGPGGLVGLEPLRLTSESTDAQSITVPVVDWSTAQNSMLGGSGGGMSAFNVEASGYVDPFNSSNVQTVTLPQGTQTIHLHAYMSTLGIDEAFWLEYYANGAAHPCEVAARSPFVADAINNQNSYVILAGDQLVAAGSMTYCSAPINEFGADLTEEVVDVSALTATEDAVLRVAMRSTTSFDFSVHARMHLQVTAPAQFAITTINHVDGAGPLVAFPEGTKLKDKKRYRMIGVPDGAKATFNKWGLRIGYEPVDAQIISVRAYVQYPTGATEDLTFTQPPSSPRGEIQLNDMGFAVVGGPRALWTTKSDDALLLIEVEARNADQTTVTTTVQFGRDQALRRPGWNLTPLYDAGLIPGALRYSTREPHWGLDGWGQKTAYEFLSLHTSLIFNDLSREVGGDPPDHDSHQVGTSIDTRYLGPNGESNALNRVGETRRLRWEEALNGNLAARTEMVEWIRANRTAMNTVLGDPRVSSILVGRVAWNYNPIRLGTYADGVTQITDPATGLWIGAFPGANASRITPANRHLDHIHIELKSRSQGNTP